MKKWQIATSIVVALVAAFSLSVAAFAQGPTPPAAGRGMAGNGQAPMAGYGFRFGMNGGSLVDITAQVTGLSTADVVAELQAGKTFAQVAQAHGKTATDVVNAFVANRKAVLDQAVADGRITQANADQLLATMKANVEEHVDEAWQPRGMGYRFTGEHPAQPQLLGPRWSR